MSRFFENWGKTRYSYRTALVFICFMTSMQISFNTVDKIAIVVTLYNCIALALSIKLDIENKELEKIELLEEFLDERNSN